ncbi:MAG: 3-oxoacyl-ACP reductase [Verrucomicrobia bacterium]|nr:MAG: 3-oxoacyl-ACP reductase [Verrucomicrobiota bacterium]
MPLTFNNKIALVTGAGRGIGKAIAKTLAQNGLKVICVSKSNNCETVANEIKHAGGDAIAYQVDVADGQAVAAACEAIIKNYGTVDILVNNAGITRDGLLLRMSNEDWDSVIATNLSSSFYWTRGLLRPMTQKRWGRIINIASVVGVIGNPGQFNYSAAKAGMIGASKSLAKEVAGRNITVNVVAPGFVETDMTETLTQDPQKAEAILKMIPLKRLGKPEEIANLVTFIASEESGYITGQIFTIDGGLAI